MATVDDQSKTCIVIGGRSFVGKCLVVRLLQLGNWIVRVADSTQSIQLDPSDRNYDLPIFMLMSATRNRLLMQCWFYTCIVGLLSKTGRLDEALNFMSSTPIKRDTIAWRTLLNACNVYRNYALGTHIGNIIFDLNRNDVGTYTLLSNMHAKANNWCGVTKIRESMRKNKIKKEPGLSWLEIKNQTHVLVLDDNKHPEFVEIHEKLKELYVKIKALGYVVDTCNVLHDVEDEQKEEYVGYHSEKLAVGYALLKTHKETPIRIIKNLRICDDCHSAMKLISKVTNRVINIRDANRFHSFNGGSCSCADYW